MRSLLFIVVAGLASSAIVLATMSFILFRTRFLDLAYWLVGWSALLSASSASLLTTTHPQLTFLPPLLATLAMPCMLLGALAHTGRPRPLWIPALGLAVAIARSIGTAAGLESLSASISIASEPAFAFGGVWVLLNPYLAAPRPVGRSDRFLALGFVLLGCLEVLDAATRARGSGGWSNWIAWLVVGVPLLATQVGAHLARAHREKRRDAAEIRALSARLDLLFRSTPEFLVETDERGVIEWVGAGSTAAGDLSVGTAVGRNVLEFLDPKSQSFLREQLSTHGRLGLTDVEASAGTIHPVCLSDGSRRWFEFLGAVRDTPAGVVRIVARLRDVTDRVEREHLLRRSEARQLRSERVAGVGSWEADLASRRFALSTEMYRIYGLDPEIRDFSFERIAELNHVDDRALVWDGWLDAIENGTSREITHRIIRPSDSATRKIRTVLEAERDESGRALRLIGSSVDVTEQVDLTSRLRRGQKRLQALIDSEFVSVFVADRFGSITEANDAFLTRLGYSKQNLPLDWRVLTAPEDRRADEIRVEQRFSPSLNRPFEKSFLTVDGERVPMMLAYAPIAKEASILVGTDLSERKRAETDRARYQQELEQIIAVRTRELLESRSRLAEHERLAAIGTLAAGVAHQINNPIGAIANCAEYALLCRGDADAMEVFERALGDNLAEARRCGQIVRSMLQFSRDQPTAKWVEDLNRVARRAHRAINAYAHDRRAVVRFVTGDDPLLVRISPIEVEQAIVNVLRNAIESRDDRVHVSIRLERRDKSATIEITDDGSGILPEHHEHLFEPFFSTRTREGGTGLGLSVAHGVFVDHGGSIQVESIPSVGTRVLLTLPLEEDTAEHLEHPSPRGGQRSRPGGAFEERKEVPLRAGDAPS